MGLTRKDTANKRQRFGRTLCFLFVFVLVLVLLLVFLLVLVLVHVLLQSVCECAQHARHACVLHKLRTIEGPHARLNLGVRGLFQRTWA